MKSDLSTGPNEDNETPAKPESPLSRIVAWIPKGLFWLVIALAYVMVFFATSWEWHGENSRFRACLLLAIAGGSLAHWLVPDRFLAWLVFVSIVGAGMAAGIIWEHRS
jgi:hypothetical protein